MIPFCCPSCQNNFAVSEALAGKSANCPGCGQLAAIPAPVALPASGEMATLPPLPGPPPAAQDRRTNGQPHPPSRDPEATQGFNKPEPGHDSSLTDFLAPAQADDELGRLGKYRILKILGHGGMGVVFQAEDLRLRRKVAIKAMLPTLAASDGAGKRFLQEAQATAAVEHDHIVRIHQVDEERGVPFLVMEFLKGEPLDVRLTRAEKLPLEEVLRIGREMAEALGAAHATGLIHRDVKPANVWLEAPRGRVKILDFGLARAVAQDAGLTEEGTVVVTPAYAASGLTQQGAIVGTPAYMAPEQGRGEAVDARCDLFSLGVVLYRLCTGQHPFKGTDTISTLREVALHQPATPIRLNAEIPQELSDLVMKLLEKGPERRPACAGEVVEALQALERKQGKGAAPRRWAPRFVAAVVLLAGLLGVGAFTLIRIQGDQGDYVFDTDDPDFSLRVNKGAVTLEDRKTNRKYNLKVVRQDRAAGASELEVTDADAGLSFKTRTFTVKRGERVALKAWFERKQGMAANRGVDAAWVKQVVATPADKQVEAVAAKLQDLNPGFDGKVTHKVEDGVVTELRFVTDKVTDISPIRVFNSLRVLDCSGTLTPDGRGNGQLADLTPLKGMNLAGLRELNLHWTQVSDAGLVHFKNCKNLTALRLISAQVSDAGLAHFKDCMNLTQLNLAGTQVSDAGLAHFKNCMNLTHLGLNGTPVSDAGLAHFKDCMNLTWLDLTGTQVSDMGLAYLRDCKNLGGLGLNFTQVSDAGLAHFKNCKNLTSLGLSGTQVSDAGLAHFKNCKNLTVLWLNGTQVGDAGLAHLKDCKNLTDLQLQKTKVTAAMIDELKKALPKCRIDWDGVDDAWVKQVAALPAEKQVVAVASKLKELNPGFDGKVTHKVEGGVVTELRFVTDKVTDISPVRVFNGLRVLDCTGTPTPDRRGNGQLADLTPLKEMNLAGLTALNLSGTQVKDADLAYFKDCKNLTQLYLDATQVSDAGLAHLKDCKNLTLLDLVFTQVRDAGLAHFKDCKNLTWLNLYGTQVGDVGLAHFKNCKSLMYLVLSWTQVSDAGLAHLKDCKNLTQLLLDGTQVSDAGLAHFKDCKNLMGLGLSGTQVSDASLAYLKDCKNLTRLHLDGTQVGDAGLVHLKDCKNLTDLRLQKTKVTAAKIEELTKALPKCKIEWDGGIIEPKEK